MNKLLVPDKNPIQQLFNNQMSLFHQFAGLIKEFRQERRKIKDSIEETIIKNLDDKVKLINDARDEIIILKELFIKKGLITREEINQEFMKMYNQRKK